MKNLALVLLFFVATSPTFAQKKKPLATGSGPWVEVEQNINEQKYQKALDLTRDILQSSMAAKNEELWTESLIKQTQLQLGLHGYETAVSEFKKLKWPTNPTYRLLLNLYYAESLLNYYRMYSWETRGRESTQSTGSPDDNLKLWTGMKIAREVRKILDETMLEKDILERPIPAFFAPYIRKGSFPQNIKPNLRDTVVDIAVTHFQDTSFWTPEQSEQVYKLPIEKMIKLNYQSRLAAAKESSHPLELVSSWFGEHFHFLKSAHLSEAALEVRYANLRILHQSFKELADKAAIVEELKKIQNENKTNAWWARGQAFLAEFTMASSAGDRYIEALEMADRGAKAYPNSWGGQACQAISMQIKRPDYNATTMVVDGQKRNSISVNYKNLSKLYLRVYPIDFKTRFLQKKFASFNSENHEEIISLLQSPPLKEWTLPLSETRDYQMHHRLISPEISKPGTYVVMISARPDFRENDNQVFALNLIVSDLVIMSQNTFNGDREIQVRDGQTGLPVNGAEVSIYKYDWETIPILVKTLKTSLDGNVIAPAPIAIVEQAKAIFSRRHYNYFVVAQKDGQSSIDYNNIGFGAPPIENVISSSFISTDRAIYRPGQNIFWKISGFQGTSRLGKFTVAKEGTEVQVTLRDANYQEVQNLKIKTNSFGTASGQFTVPPGRGLGRWSIVSSLGGASTAIAVEEYKRPTFEVELSEAKSPLRLNKKAKIEGQAKYYFGQNVTSGKVIWRISKQRVLPYWGRFYNWYFDFISEVNQEEKVANGTAELKADGKFEIEFNPSADETLQTSAPGTSFQYLVSVDMTDEGGETRSNSRSYRIGFTTLETDLNQPDAFYEKNKEFSIEASLHQLDGRPRAGEAKFRIVQLKQPQRALRPAELPRQIQPGNTGGPISIRTRRGNISVKPSSSSNASRNQSEQNYSIEDDLKRPRYETDFSWQQIVAQWPDGETIQSGSLKHAENGSGKMDIKSIAKPGAYRIYYEIADDFNNPFKLSSEFLVVGPQQDLAVPLVLLPQKSSVNVGENLKILVHSGIIEQPITLEVYHSNELVLKKEIISGKTDSLISIPIHNEHRGGLFISAYGLTDYQFLRTNTSVFVPWNDRQLKLDFSSFRDKIKPGTKEAFKISVSNYDGTKLSRDEAEILAVMYDRSLDFFGFHSIMNQQSIYPNLSFGPTPASNLSALSGRNLKCCFNPAMSYSPLYGNQLQFLDNYGIGGPGNRYGGGGRAMLHKMRGSNGPVEESYDSLQSGIAAAPASRASLMADKDAANEIGSLGEVSKLEAKAKSARTEKADLKTDQGENAGKSSELRSQFSETAFFYPHVQLDDGGQASISFQVPDSVTSWKVLANAVTRDLRSGNSQKETASIKDLMVRPYLPRFLREGDNAEIKVVVNNASQVDLEGAVNISIQDEESDKPANSEFGLSQDQIKKQFKLAKNSSTAVSFTVKAPQKVGSYSFTVTAKTENAGAGNLSDGEKRSLPVLPSRVHLTQSRFVTLKNVAKKTLEFKDLANTADKTRVNEKMVVTLDTQLFFNVLQSLPYLVNYPYECTEQTLNRFLSTGIMSSLFTRFPDLAKMAKSFATRSSQFEKFNEPDANRKLMFEETPWLNESQGNIKGQTQDDSALLRILDESVVKKERISAIEKLKKMQRLDGSFPWFEGGQPDEYMTLYILLGFSRALEFKVDVPKEMVTKAFGYIRTWLDSNLNRMISNNCCWETITLINFALSSFPDPSWLPKEFDLQYRERLLKYSFTHWKNHSPLLKGYLALTLNRMNRKQDAKLVWDSVMDSAKSNEDQGTFWAAEDRSWLWYNDTIETHAFSIRTLMELNSANPKLEGLVQWLFLNKKLNHWKSTKATAEAVYSLAKYLESTNALGQKEVISIDWGSQKTEMTFNPDVYTGKKNQIVIEGNKIEPVKNSKIIIEKNTPGFAFASATWNFSTEEMPKQESGDFFKISRKYYLRNFNGKEWSLKEIEGHQKVKIGDQVEVQISIRLKHAAQYVHLRDPRGSGFEPETNKSGYKWNLGISWFEEVRDSATNFFFHQLPVGEYTFKYRLRANMAGEFKVGPATIQSIYAPEFNAYSTGQLLQVGN